MEAWPFALTRSSQRIVPRGRDNDKTERPVTAGQMWRAVTGRDLKCESSRKLPWALQPENASSPRCVGRGVVGQPHRAKLPGLVALDADPQQQHSGLELRIDLGEVIRIVAHVLELLVAIASVIHVFCVFALGVARFGFGLV